MLDSSNLKIEQNKTENTKNKKNDLNEQQFATTTTKITRKLLRLIIAEAFNLSIWWNLLNKTREEKKITRKQQRDILKIKTRERLKEKSKSVAYFNYLQWKLHKKRR